MTQKVGAKNTFFLVTLYSFKKSGSPSLSAVPALYLASQTFKRLILLFHLIPPGVSTLFCLLLIDSNKISEKREMIVYSKIF